MKISVIIINYKGNFFVNKLIDSLNNQILLPNEIIVIDNDYNSELSGTYFDTKFRIRYYVNKKNVGFAKAVNIGVYNAINDNIILINNDIYLDKYFISIIKDYFIKKAKTFFCPLVLDYKGIFIDSAGDIISNDIKPVKRFSNIKYDSIKLKEEYIQAFSMSVCGFSKKDFIYVGGLREDFFMYFEDTEFSLRAKAKDYNILFIPRLKAYHFISGSTKLKTGNIYSPEKVFNESKNRVLLLEHFINKKRFSIFLFFIKGTIVSFIFHLIKSHYAMNFMQGTFEGMKQLMRRIK